MRFILFVSRAVFALKAALTDDDVNMVVPLLVNYDSNKEEQHQWVMDNLTAIGGGMLNRKRQDHNDVGWRILDGNYGPNARLLATE